MINFNLLWNFIIIISMSIALCSKQFEQDIDCVVTFQQLHQIVQNVLKKKIYQRHNYVLATEKIDENGRKYKAEIQIRYFLNSSVPIFMLLQLSYCQKHIQMRFSYREDKIFNVSASESYIHSYFSGFMHKFNQIYDQSRVFIENNSLIILFRHELSNIFAGPHLEKFILNSVRHVDQIVDKYILQYLANVTEFSDLKQKIQKKSNSIQTETPLKYQDKFSQIKKLRHLKVYFYYQFQKCSNQQIERIEIRKKLHQLFTFCSFKNDEKTYKKKKTDREIEQLKLNLDEIKQLKKKYLYEINYEISNEDTNHPLVTAIDNQQLVGAYKRNIHEDYIYQRVYSFYKKVTVSNFKLPQSQQSSKEKKYQKKLVVKKRRQNNFRNNLQFNNQLDFLYYFRDMKCKHMASYYMPCIEVTQANYWQRANQIYIQKYEKSLGETDFKGKYELILNIMYSVMKVIWHLHNRKIIHRDIKRVNIMLDMQYNPKMIDFQSFAYHYKKNHNYEDKKDPKNLSIGTDTYFISYDKIKHQDIGQRYTEFQFRYHEFYDLYSYGQTFEKIIDEMDGLEPNYGFLKNQLKDIILRCKQQDPSLRLPPQNCLLELYMLKKIIRKKAEKMDENR